MIALLYSIIFSSLLFIIFKLFKTYKIHTLQAIIVNYFTAFTIGILSYNQSVSFNEIIEKPWFFGGISLSFCFIIVFNLMALTAQKNGVTVASVAGKMAVVIPVVFGIYLYNEQLNFTKGAGILMALVAVILSTKKDKTTSNNANYTLPFLLFLGAGIIDTLLKYVQTNYVPANELSIFSAFLFLGAGLLGIVLFTIKKSPIQAKNGLAGVVLGIINYYSIFYLLKALDIKTMTSGALFTINNVAIVMLTTLIGLVLFKEKLNRVNWIGIALAILAIIVISL